MNIKNNYIHGFIILFLLLLGYFIEPLVINNFSNLEYDRLLKFNKRKSEAFSNKNNKNKRNTRQIIGHVNNTPPEMKPLEATLQEIGMQEEEYSKYDTVHRKFLDTNVLRNY